MNEKEVEYTVYIPAYSVELTKYTDGTVHIHSYDKSFKNLKNAIRFLKFKKSRIKHFKWNRKKRKEVKMYSKKILSFLNEKEE